MINIKDNMEKDLYMRFLLLLNAKKKRIRELQKALNSNKQTTKSVYEETTDDESEKSDVEGKKMHGTASSNSSKVDYKSEQKVAPKSSKINFRKRTNFSSSEDTSPEPSTSKDKLTLQNIDMCHTIKSKQVLNISEEESEEDLFS
ncbi:dna repair protein xrcc4 [Lasius niger]|uniref:Dna repair protein xrcc4 n=1 Tax=Lasius niger TaxID=67767 RepID=A0A0J7NMP6_LASNI|nr:dna repair protein xrcc4 [Lasius niger]